jgi:hypothetical protein
MRAAALFSALALMPVAVTAHPGMHVHPHGAPVDAGLAIAAALAILVLALIAVRRRG